MLCLIPLAALLIVGAPEPNPAGDRSAAAIAPFLGDEVGALVHVDLARINVDATVRSVVGKLADEEDVNSAIQGIGGWVDALKRAGVKDVYVLVDPTDLPGLPIVVFPLAEGADGKAIAAVITAGGPGRPARWPAAETIRGAVVGGTPAALARIRSAAPAPRPELAAALSVGAGDVLQVVLMPSNTQRRALEESLTVLPPQFGGAPITSVTRGARWASVALDLGPKPTLRAILQASDNAAAQSLEKVLGGALDLLAQRARNDPALATLANAFSQTKPQVVGDRITLEADPQKTAELIAVPIRQARAAARRSQCVNNLKQIGLAMHNYHAKFNNFPPAFSASKEGKPLLSWRVHLLPLIDQAPLYAKFHLDEPWNSAHNRALIGQMPRVYACPDGSRALAREGKTTYLTPRGPATIFPGAEPVKIQEITDGTSNTIMVVDVSDSLAVTWTKPDDWDVGPELNIKELLGHHPRGTNISFADGSVRFLKETIKPKTLQTLLTRNGGEVISSDDL
ncbi:MAG: DUF1559 domain-containing protein [Isosphaeraceae bacterium]|nr:DUF1559 domain-containing protein [Isosphaeraceae bacterium]